MHARSPGSWRSRAAARRWWAAVCALTAGAGLVAPGVASAHAVPSGVPAASAVTSGVAGSHAVASGAADAHAVLAVPARYATIQAAIDAAAPGDIIKVAPGEYRGQLTITKSLAIIGSGPRATVVRAPATLVPDVVGRDSIVAISAGVRVAMAWLGVAGPAASTCDDAGLNAGIRVVGGASLFLTHARVADIVNTPSESCDHHGNAISIGDFATNDTGHAVIQDVDIIHYTGNGVAAFDPGTTVTLTRSVIDARPDESTNYFTGGVEIGNGATARITYNVIRGNRCHADFAPCGSDPINEFQASGIGNGPGDLPDPDSVIAYNRLVGNDIGLYLFGGWGDCCHVHDNQVVDSLVFGIAIQDGSAEVTGGSVTRSPIGVAVVADAVDTVGTLRGVSIRGSGQATKTIQCCGFTATVVRR